MMVNADFLCGGFSDWVCHTFGSGILVCIQYKNKVGIFYQSVVFVTVSVIKSDNLFPVKKFEVIGRGRMIYYYRFFSELLQVIVKGKFASERISVGIYMRG